MPEAKFTIKGHDKSKKVIKDVRAGLKKLSSTIFSMKGAIVGLAGVGGFGMLIRQSLSSVDALAKTSDKLKITTESLAGLHHATNLYTSVGAKAMNEALTKATKRLGEFNATGGGAAARWIEKLNLDTQRLAQQSPDQLFNRYAESIRGLNDRGQQLAAISALMGDESRALIGIIDAGSGAIENATKKAMAYGTALSRVDAAKIEAANDALFEAREAIRGAAITITTELAPYIKLAAEKFAQLSQKSGGFKNEIVGGIESVSLAFAYLGDVIQGIRFAFKGMEVVFSGVATGIIWWFQVMSKPFIEFGKLIPGVGDEFESFGDAVQGTLEQAAKRTGILKDEFDAIALEGLPHEKVVAFFAEYRAELNKTSQAIADSGLKGGIGGGGNNDGDDPKQQALADKLKSRIETIRQSQLTERELLIEKYSNDLADLNMAESLKVESLASYQTLREQLKQKHEDTLNRIQLKGLTDSEKLAQAFRKSDLKGAFAAGSKVLQGLSQTNKGIFELNKGLALANVAVNLPSAIIESFEKGGGYPWGLVPAGLMLAQGLQQISAINSASFGGGGRAPSVGGGGGGGGGGVSSPVPVVPINAGLEQQSSFPSEIHITLDGTAIPDDPEFLDDFAEKIAQNIRNGGRSPIPD